MIKLVKVLLLISFLWACSLTEKNQLQRELAQIDDQLAIGELKLDETFKFILLGVNGKSEQYYKYNAQSLGFTPLTGDLTSIVPKYLFVFEGDEIKSVKSFELGSRKPPVTPALEKSFSRDRVYVYDDDDKKMKLPYELLDVEKARRDRIGQSILDMAVEVGLKTPLIPLVAFIDKIRTKKRIDRNYQSAYLEKLIELSLFERKLPEFSQAFGLENLWELGAALNIRFAQQSLWSPFGVNQNNKIELYRIYQNSLRAKRSINMSRLIQRANEEGLIAVPLSTDFAMLFYDKKNPIPKEHFSNFMLGINDIDEVQRLSKLMTYEKGSLIPLGVFTTNEDITPAKVLDFTAPDKIIKDENMSNLIDDVLGLGFSFLPFSAIVASIGIANDVLRFVVRKKGGTLHIIRLRSEAELAAVMESGIVSFDYDDIIQQTFKEQLSNLGLSEDAVQRYSHKLLEASEDEKEELIDEIIELQLAKQTERRHYSNLDLDKIEANKYLHWKAMSTLISSPKDKTKMLKKLGRKYNKTRKVASTPRATRPAIAFFMDGLRPDRFHDAIERGLMPNLKEIFISNGIEINSFTSRSLTLPSWGTILTGYDPDRHGVRSNQPLNRKDIDDGGLNFTDPRKDFLYPSHWKGGRSYEILQESGLPWLPDFYEKEEVLLNYMPYNNEFTLPIGSIIIQAFQSLGKIFNQAMIGSLALDVASARSTVKQIKRNPGRYKLIINWYASVDELSHHNNENLDEVYRVFDKELGEVIAAAHNDPILKEAVFYLISDHGMTGGFESSTSPYRLNPKGGMMKNTGFNLVTYFAGDYNSHHHYDFTVKTFTSTRPDHDLKYLQEFLIHPYKVVYRGKHKSRPEKVNMMLESSGDALAQVYLAHPESGWALRPNYYDLSHYKLRSGKRVNLFEDLFNMSVQNIMTVDYNVRKALKKETQFKPVKFMAVALRQKNVRTQIQQQLNLKTKLSRDPILLMGQQNKMALILTTNTAGVNSYRYVVLSEFEQEPFGTIHFNVSQDAHHDPLDYLSLAINLPEWKTDRRWLQELQSHTYPTAVFTLVQLLTIDPIINHNQTRVGERPDMLIMGQAGFNFNNGNPTEADHGSIEYQQVRNSLFIGSFSQEVQTKLKTYDGTPFLNKDFVPTVLDFSGITKTHPLWHPQWRPLRKSLKIK